MYRDIVEGGGRGAKKSIVWKYHQLEQDKVRKARITTQTDFEDRFYGETIDGNSEAWTPTSTPLTATAAATTSTTATATHGVWPCNP